MKILFRLFKLIIWIVVVGWWILWWNYTGFTNTRITHVTDTIVIPKGSTFSSVIEEYTDAPFYAKLYLRLDAPDFALQAWEYEVSPSNTLPNFLNELQDPIKEEEMTVTFLEGWNIFDIDSYLTNRRLIEAWEFINYAENGFKDLSPDYPFIEAALSLEGFLYPDTYNIVRSSFTPEVLSRKMLDNFSKRVYIPYLANADAETIYDLVNLASIVEKEEKNAAEKSTVAGILKKRWQEDWQIGADITVCYPQRLTSEECKFSVTKYLYEQNEYNTRQKTWLPLTPIGNPSAETVEATLNHKETPYYFYLHNVASWKIYYATTNAEHERNKALYLR